MRRLHVAMAVTVALSFAVDVRRVYAAGRAGARRGQTPPRQWWVNKDKGGQFGKNKVHIKLADLKARHKGQPNWSEVVVDDENYPLDLQPGAPGTKITPRMRPDTREFFVVVEGEMRFTLEGQPEPILDQARVGREHPEKDDVFGRSHWQRSGALGRRQPGELQDARAGDRSATAANARRTP